MWSCREAHGAGVVLSWGEGGYRQMHAAESVNRSLFRLRKGLHWPLSWFLFSGCDHRFPSAIVTQTNPTPEGRTYTGNKYFGVFGTTFEWPSRNKSSDEEKQMCKISCQRLVQEDRSAYLAITSSAIEAPVFSYLSQQARSQSPPALGLAFHGIFAKIDI
jgi:hypothetical protein